MWKLNQTSFSARQTATLFVVASWLLCACSGGALKTEITAEMAFEGVSNYCHRTFDWEVADEGRGVMSVEMGEESDSTFKVVFRSYTAALTYFYVNKSSGVTRMVEYVPGLEITEEAGTINLFDYLKGD